MPSRDEQTRARLRKLLDELDYAHRSYPGPERRREPRLSFRRITPQTRVVQVSGDVLETQTVTRNLCSGGVGLLHKPFVYPGSQMVISLMPMAGKPIHLAGRVLACRYTGDRYHESSVGFDQRIDLARFISDAEKGKAQKHLNRVRRRLDGLRIVLIDPTGKLHASMAESFEALGARVTVAAYLGKALDHMRTGPVDLLFCGHAHDGADASQIVRLCRDSGYTSPVIAMGWPPRELARARALPNAGVIASIDPNSEHEALDLLGSMDLKPMQAQPNT